MIKQALIAATLCLAPLVGQAFDFDEQLDSQGAQVKGFFHNLDQKIYDTVPSAKAGELLGQAFGEIKGVIAQQILSDTKKTQINSFSKAMLEKFTSGLPLTMRAKISPELQATLLQFIQDASSQKVNEYNEQLNADIINSLPRCKDGLKMDLMAMLFGSSSSDEKAPPISFVFTKPCVIKESRIQQTINAILMNHRNDISKQTEDFFIQSMK